MRAIFLSLLVLCSCAQRHTLMTRRNFDAVYLGEPIAEVEKNSGEPFTTRKQKDGSIVYEYIERIPVGQQVVEENHYYLVIRDGQVVSKQMNREKTPGYDFIYDDDPNDVELQ